MKNEEKARKIIGNDCKKENCLECGGRLSAEKGCAKFRQIMEMAEWKDKCFNEVIEHLRETYQLDEQVMFILKLVESRYNDKMK